MSKLVAGLERGIHIERRDTDGARVTEAPSAPGWYFAGQMPRRADASPGSDALAGQAHAGSPPW